MGPDQGGTDRRHLGYARRGQNLRAAEVPHATVPDSSDSQPRAPCPHVREVPGMPKLDFPVLADGLIVDVLIGLDGETTTTLVAAGRPITVPIRARGEIDTGSNVTAVS